MHCVLPLLCNIQKYYSYGIWLILLQSGKWLPISKLSVQCKHTIVEKPPQNV